MYIAKNINISISVIKYRVTKGFDLKDKCFGGVLYDPSCLIGLWYIIFNIKIPRMSGIIDQ